MTSYNSYDGTASTANDWILNKKLKGDWGFKGFVISDANSTGGSVVLHRTAKDYAQSATQAVNGGLDVIFQTDYSHHKLFSPGVLGNELDQKRFDDAVSRVLRAKFQLGLFENPYVDENAALLKSVSAHKQVALKAALESIVLLKNSSQTRPLSKDVKTIPREKN